ncbi:MAG: hypothetical protein UR90_C0007G0008 [Parcubacteria group bacterium GW2011_GWC1_35_8]|uniref:Type 4 fimbrial biogenesis protein PilX N-terminal domain-containing protein n=2 Tax=Candidatus Nomuraibacteriota TaxID=1752729 RepID=A0A1F6YV53_9BACT|nr:MAG: hypothetical protein UR90_C0007G0008 [Parcubacteria group bacterium GW2011_GWC1_35_8]KKP88544.1 MAG: hypothetical protein UR91_C0016G0007 [Candidatus Nomurabacteria bacterium GW2011_GWC2_35_8]OGJ06308.1 MAG: hypothetical protein A2238_00475 [Candidatus Nomurabacteria bacterium RIFOXYA2_FULL_35_9]OGJ10252.1 MAG: hypothetical protein A2456_03260 [Candidatus Nomurabacteria bacterium RIFOXYC2_FULL_36_19]OGJ14299.1 MAG: hypothetical protein A2554_00815 [Candidatus Nomurabacteria bacterium RI
MKHKDLQKNNRGFVILFAVTISSIILAIALGVSNVALKEIMFGTSAKDTNEAFFAADTGAEFVLLKDKSLFYTQPDPGNESSWSEIIPEINGIVGGSCAKVTIRKYYIAEDMVTTVISKGYNVGDDLCTSTSLNRIEREIKISY